MGHPYPPPPKGDRVYIDGDNLPYRIGFATQRTIYVLDVEGEATVSPLLVTTSKRKVNKFLKNSPDLLMTELYYVEDFIQALNTLKLTIQGIVQGSGCKSFRIVLTDEGSNFRNSIATIQPYKGNREGMEKPHHWAALREWLESMPYTIVAVGEEADDFVSRAMIHGYVGASNDKDLDNTPGWHYNFIKGEKYYVDENTAIRNFYTQCLTGDSTDHIPGIPKVGPVTAEKILSGRKDAHGMEAAVLEAYVNRMGLSEEEALARLTEVGQLLWMRREEDEVWQPLTAA